MIKESNTKGKKKNSLDFFNERKEELFKFDQFLKKSDKIIYIFIILAIIFSFLSELIYPFRIFTILLTFLSICLFILIIEIQNKESVSFLFDLLSEMKEETINIKESKEDLKERIEKEIKNCFILLNNYLESEEIMTLNFLIYKRKKPYYIIHILYYFCYILSGILILTYNSYIIVGIISIFLLFVCYKIREKHFYFFNYDIYYFLKGKKICTKYQNLLSVFLNSPNIQYPILKKKMNRFNKRLEYYRSLIRPYSQILKKYNIIPILSIIISVFYIRKIIITFLFSISIIDIFFICIFFYLSLILPLRKIRKSERYQDYKKLDKELIKKIDLIQEKFFKLIPDQTDLTKFFGNSDNKDR